MLRLNTARGGLLMRKLLHSDHFKTSLFYGLVLAIVIYYSADITAINHDIKMAAMASDSTNLMLRTTNTDLRDEIFTVRQAITDTVRHFHHVVEQKDHEINLLREDSILQDARIQQLNRYRLPRAKD